MHHPLWIIGTTLVIGACGTEPNPDIVGTWALTSNLTGGTIACTRSASLVIVSSERSVTGNLIENQVSCTDGGEAIAVVTQTRGVAGSLDGRDISFTTQIPPGADDCAFEAFAGRVTEAAMSGAVETRAVFCQGTFVQMRGTWEAQLQSPDGT